MKRRSASTFIAVTAFVMILFCSWTGHAFHEGGADYCQGCHDAKSRRDQTGILMLNGSDPTSTCLNCHAESGELYNILSAEGSSYTPGGDFYWLQKTFVRDRVGEYYQSSGDSHGHNVVALDYGLISDTSLSTAPGGVYDSNALGCNSCHDPHARLNSRYRLLAGKGYEGGSQSSGILFTTEAPLATADSQNWTETDFNHPSYGSGMSEWCTNCHTDFINGGAAMGGITHPSGQYAKLSKRMISNYNAYIKTGDLGGEQSNAYLSLVPFELGTTDAFLLDPTSRSGPDPAGNSNVMCLTCHRAHASAFQNIGRWDFRTTFISDSTPHNRDAGVSGTDVLNSYYGRDMIAEFGEYQRQFCNKCHVYD